MCRFSFISKSSILPETDRLSVQGESVLKFRDQSQIFSGDHPFSTYAKFSEKL